MAFDFNGARVVITGGASGIGLALGRRMAAVGARLFVCDRDADRIDPALDALREAGAVEAHGLAVDVTDGPAFEAFIADAIDRMGGIDVGWNNAGIMGVSSPLQDLGWSDYRALMEVNLDAVFRGSQRFAQAMIRQGTPALILNTGSENSLFHGVPGGGAYVATKAAVRALTRSLDEDTPRHIQAQLICPGFVHTQLGPDEQFRHGMHADRFADIAFPQIGADRFFILTHGYNAVRVREETDRLLGEFETSGAASAEDTARYDVRSIYESLT